MPGRDDHDLRPLPRRPVAVRKLKRVAVRSVSGEVSAEILDVAQEQSKRVRDEAWIARLRQAWSESVTQGSVVILRASTWRMLMLFLGRAAAFLGPTTRSGSRTRSSMSYTSKRSSTAMT